MSFERLLKPRTIAIFGGVQAGRKGDVRYIFTYKIYVILDLYAT